MTANETIKKGWTCEDFLALLERGRQIKARRQKEAEEWYAERQRRKKEAGIAPRNGWAAAAMQAHADGEDKLLATDVFEDEKMEDWKW